MVSGARSIALAGRETHNKAANHPLGLWVSDRTRGRGLLHARDHQARLGGLDWRRVCWVTWVGRNRSLRGLGLVANTICFDAVFSPALLSGPLDLTHANLPRHLARGASLRMARTGGVPLSSGSYWPAAGLFDRGDVSEMDGLRAGRGPGSGGCRYLCRHCGVWTCRDAPDCWCCGQGRIGARARENYPHFGYERLTQAAEESQLQKRREDCESS